MASTQNFRTALNGFHRQDVVNYIEYMNNRHNSQIQQLNTQLQNAKADPELQARLEAAEARIQELEEAGNQELEAAQARIQELEAQLAAAQAAPQATPAAPVAVVAAPSPTEQELEAYRRAERAERLANERAMHLQERANAILADVSLQADAYVKDVQEAQNLLLASLERFRTTITSLNPNLEQAAQTLGQIKAEK